MCREDDVLRAVTLASMNMFSNIWNIWYSIVAWPIVDAPRFRKGQIATLVTGAVSVLIACAIVFCSRRFGPRLQSPSEVVSVDEAGDAEGHLGPESDAKTDVHGVQTAAYSR